jgi:hypothetical protein
MPQQTDKKTTARVSDGSFALSDLGSGNRPGLTPVLGNFLAEAAMVCLERAQHAPGVMLEVRGDTPAKYQIVWGPVTQQMLDAYEDADEAVSFGACGIACLLVECMEGLTIVSRSCKGTGFDYWLGNGNRTGEFFQTASRLEVSGLAEESGSNTVSERVQQKLIQTEQSDDTSLPAIVVVVLFAHPSAHKETKL